MLGRHDPVEELTIRQGELVLHASLGVPPGAAGVVIFAHGSGSSRTSPRNQRVAAALRARGLATLLFDLLTEAEELVDRLDGSLRFDIPLLARRLVGVTDWVRRASPVAHLPLAYFGASTGAAAALVAAAERPADVRAVVSRGGRPDLATHALPRVVAPCLFIVGGNDPQVLALNRDAIAQMAAPTQLAIVPGASHLFEEPGALDDVVQLASEWLIDHLEAAYPDADPPHPPGDGLRDRRVAGSDLVPALRPHAGADAAVFGLSHGGMLVADEVARELAAPLDVWLVRKLGMPIQPALGMGALAEGAALVLDPMMVRWSGATPRTLTRLVHQAATELRLRARRYRGEAPPLSLDGRTAVLVDDAIVTELVPLAAIRGARRRGAARVVLATPVGAAATIARLREEVDAVVCTATPRELTAATSWYQRLRPVSDEQVLAVLREARRRPGVTPPTGNLRADR